jgi:hypothetical protein
MELRLLDNRLQPLCCRVSVDQIKREILNLTSAERPEVSEYPREPETSAASADDASDHERFDAARSHLFTHYGRLLERLEPLQHVNRRYGFTL